MGREVIVHTKGDTHWRCEHPVTKDVKMAAKPEHAAKLVLDGYECEIYHEMAAPDVEEDDEQ